jgi:hypothetical protein
MKDLASKFYMSENTGFFKILYGHLKLSRLYSFVISTIRKMTSIFFYAEQEKNEMVGKYMVSMKQLNCVLGSNLTLIFSCMSGPQFIFLEKGQSFILSPLLINVSKRARAFYELVTPTLLHGGIILFVMYHL